MLRGTLFIDGQVFQSVAWDRGMGKYSLSLLESMAVGIKAEYTKTYIVFTKNMPLEAEAKKAIKQAAPEAEHLFLELKVPADPSLDNIPEMQAHNQASLDKLIAQYAEAEFSYFILALFIDQVCITFPTGGSKILLFYDLIPLQYSERYSLLNSYENYLAKYKTVFEADLILTISQTVADDVALNLGIDQSKIFNINGAPIERVVNKAQKPPVKLPKRFVLMPSGDEIRKNNVRAVQGFEIYRREANDSDIVLVLTSHFQEATRDTLREYSKNVIFTGNVPEEELRWLYENAQALLFVSEYEGLGLPVLEAARFGLPIACSNLAVFNEISSSAFYYADPFDPSSIAGALKSAMLREDFGQKIVQYPEILQHYTWQNTAKLALKMLTSIVKQDVRQKIRLAVMAPSPSGYSAIGKLIMQLHPAMSDYFYIDYYTESGKTQRGPKRPNYLPYISNVLPSTVFDHKSYKNYDAVLYHMGNSEFHLDTIKNSLYLPGYAIFHDTHLTQVFEGALLNYGYISENRLEAEKMIDKKVQNPHADYITTILNNQQAVVAHSNYTAKALTNSKIGNNIDTAKLNLPTAVPNQPAPIKVNVQRVIGLAGIIHPAKGLDVIESLAQTDVFSDCIIHIFGLSLVPDEVISRLRTYPNVVVDTDLTDFQFQTRLSQLDVLINFRTEYRGETSLATIEAMRYGVVPIVKKIGWYDELPDEVVVKVSSTEELAAELRSLITDDPRLTQMKQAARAYIAESHSYQDYAKGLYELILNHKQNGKQDKQANALKNGASLSTLQRLLES
jgi:glycosyltransferase involved in cell wall biosynthesis